MKSNDRNFMIDLNLGERAEIELANLLRLNLKNFRGAQKVDYKKHPYDLRITIERDDETTFDKCIEVKSLEGRHETGVVEIWADDAKSKRPHWWSPQTDIIVFQDRSRKKWFFYDAQSVIDHLTKYPGSLTRAKNDCADDSGWLGKFYWNPNEASGPFVVEHFKMPGFLCEMVG